MFDAFRPITFLLPQGAASQVSLKPGQVLQGVISENEGALFVLVRGQKVPIEAQQGLTAGQRVSIEIIKNDAGPVLRLTPQPAQTSAPPPAPPPPSAEALRGALFDALKTLGAVSRANVAARIPPAWLPPSADAVRQLVSLFLLRDTLGPDIRQIAQWVQQAVSARALPAQNLEEVLFLFSGADAPKIAARLRELVRYRSTEARLASIASGENPEMALSGLERELRTVVKRLLEDEAFQGFLRGHGKLRAFQQTAQRTLDRLDGAAAQNLRGIEQPYAFLELPMPSEAPVRHAQVHFFSRGRGTGREHALAALDLETTRLGSLWVTLYAAPGQCNCHFRATDQDAVDAIDAAADELADALRTAGYPNPRVAVSLWDGDRLAAAAEFLDGFNGVDLSA